jgi:SH3-like domain-containing protein
MWEALNMREAPSDDAAVVAELPGRTPLLVTHRTRDNRWYAAQTESGVSGWVASGYVELLTITQAELPIEGDSAPAPQAQPSQPEPGTEAAEEIPAAADANARVAAALLNMRSAPDTGASILAQLPQGTGLQAIARSADTAWVQVRLGDGTTGWVAAAYLATTLDFAELPIAGAEPVAAAPDGEIQPAAAPTASGLDAYFVLGANARPIFAQGQQMGNRADVFSKVGDSITAEEVMFRPFGYDRYTLGGFGYLQPTIDFYRDSSARTDNSFNNDSLAARPGWTTASVLDPNFASSAVCEPGETPLACEYRLTRPAVALIMFGSNDVIWLQPDQYAYNLRAIVNITRDAGVIPVLSTIPLRRGYEDRTTFFNQLITQIAAESGTSLWDYGAAMNTLPNNGLSQDGLHPSIPPEGFAESANFTGEHLQYGYVMRNLTALHALHTIRTQVIGG